MNSDLGNSLTDFVSSLLPASGSISESHKFRINVRSLPSITVLAMLSTRTGSLA
jgi:hypothetical protein